MFRRDWIRNVPIDRKLMMIMLLTVTASMLVAGLSFLVADLYSTWRSTRGELSATAELLGINSESALAFEDSEIAEQTLGSLRAKSNILGACLYSVGAKVIASYAREGLATHCPDAPEAPLEPELVGGELVVLHPVVHRGERIGSVYLRSDLSALYTRTITYLGATVLAMVFAILIGVVLTKRLRPLVTNPILRLVDAVEEISRDQSYSTRVVSTGNDEIGALIDGFNGMLDQIQLRDEDLRKAHGELEARVLQRTAELRGEVAVRQRAERAAEIRAEELGRSNKELERYAYVASHDLKEPLRAVAGFAQLLGKRYKGQLDERADDYIGHMVQGAERMQNLLQDLLTYSRAGSDTGKFEQIHLETPLKDALTNLSVLLEDTGAEIEYSDLPELKADAGQLVQVFQNLIGNAIKFRREGATPKVQVRARRLDDAWEVSVSDNGIGIDPEYRMKIFKIFERLHSRGEYEGTGIGLSVCEKIVQRHNGKIHVDASPEGGSKFTFTLSDHLPEMEEEE